MFERLAMGFANVRAGARVLMLVLVLVQAGAEGAGVHMSGSSVCACVRMRACACASEPRRARAQVCTLYKLDDVMLKGLLARPSPFFVPGSPHAATLTELRLALNSYQDYHMLLTIAGARLPAARADAPPAGGVCHGPRGP